MPANNFNISPYAAADLMRYATGRMSSAEMHTLEKAALEDPFLAEALEGYKESVATQPEAVLQEQINRLDTISGKQKAPVIPLWRRKVVQLVVAACFVAGAGWLIFSLVQKPRPQSNEVVISQKAEPTIPPPDNSFANRMAADSNLASQPVIEDSQFQSPLLVAQKPDLLQKPVPAPGTVAFQKTNEPATTFSTPIQSDQKAERADAMMMDSNVTASSTTQNMELVALPNKEKKVALRQTAPVLQHIFKGKIIDAGNHPLPYSNVMVEGQNFGTYSDAYGNFNFISDDSILPVQVRSVGFLNQIIALKEDKQETKIVMQEDKRLNDNLALTVQQNKYKQAPVAKSIIETDSIIGSNKSGVGVPFYDTYLMNNNRISQQPVLNREVQLSFEVTKGGEATNITVIKSAGKALDEEAIRLVKEGPKLKPDNGNGTKKRVVVRF